VVTVVTADFLEPALTVVTTVTRVITVTTPCDDLLQEEGRIIFFLCLLIEGQQDNLISPTAVDPVGSALLRKHL
jgi:hypothetical protein